MKGFDCLAALVFSGMVLCAVPGCIPGGDAAYCSVQGFTQGTSYSVTYQHPDQLNLKAEIDSLLRVFDASLNTYDSTSLISRINRNLSFEADSLFQLVFREAERIHELSGGAFDISLAPVIDAWGFGDGERLEVDTAMIDSMLAFVGMDGLTLEGGHIQKRDPRISMNVNAIAQGFAVDFLADYLEGLGCRNYMVEVGGEIRTRGRNPGGQFWRIGIDRPDYGNMWPGQELQAIISMHNRSLATSGNYRKFYMKDGKRITHSIDPSTGFPKESELLSVTILCDDCMTADALATSCMVKGLEASIDFIQHLDGVDAFLIYGDEFGAYQVWMSDELKHYIEKP
ncbi:MAG: thiamine biosynthesis protein ApbE [Bacteroidetes bacterium]|nr:MAG: thiamine biosynthesis protein ApbE [Bacteroidota bacterium]